SQLLVPRFGVDDLCSHREHVAGSDGVRPAQFVDAERTRRRRVGEDVRDEQFHRHRGGMPAAGDQSTEQGVARGRLVGVERLWIVALGEFEYLRTDDVALTERVRLADLDVL